MNVGIVFFDSRQQFQTPCTPIVSKILDLLVFGAFALPADCDLLGKLHHQPVLLGFASQSTIRAIIITCSPFSLRNQLATTVTVGGGGTELNSITVTAAVAAREDRR